MRRANAIGSVNARLLLLLHSSSLQALFISFTLYGSFTLERRMERKPRERDIVEMILRSLRNIKQNTQKNMQNMKELT